MPLAPLRRQTLLTCDPEAALSLWVDRIGAWWPLEAFSVFGAEAAVAFDGDRIVETAPDGRTALWGSVTERTADALAFTWHPGYEQERASHVRVRLVPAGADRTLVTLTHDGWERHADPEGARARYATGWVDVLDRLAAAVPADDADAWLVLEHRAGPATPPSGVFSSPDFRKHLAFLGSLREAGVLVAAGPLPDEAGAGMTIVRARGSAAAVRIIDRAQLDDGAVAAGLLDVRVRPWRVVMTG